VTVEDETFLDVRKDATEEREVLYRLRQAFIRLCEIKVDRRHQPKLLELQKKTWSLKADVASDEDPHPFTENSDWIDKELGLQE
jgi:hypothetical protein